MSPLSSLSLYTHTVTSTPLCTLPNTTASRRGMGYHDQRPHADILVVWHQITLSPSTHHNMEVVTPVLSVVKQSPSLMEVKPLKLLFGTCVQDVVSGISI